MYRNENFIRDELMHIKFDVIDYQGCRVYIIYYNILIYNY